MYNERWFSSRTIMLSDEWHVRFGFVHVAFSLPSHAIGDLLYKKRMREKKRWCLAVSDLQANAR